jgi:hypothetical protein
MPVQLLTCLRGLFGVLPCAISAQPLEVLGAKFLKERGGVG